MAKKMAFYLRLSLADGDLGKDSKDESNSIENQRLLLHRFAEANAELRGEIQEYVDDGYTGTNFRRPAFQKMIRDAKEGKICTILTKDLSRLGRDYVGVGDYLEQIFPVLGIRFIAVNSNYDSNKYTGKTMGLDMALNNLVNSLYSRDISQKVKSALKTRWKNGICTSSRLPYGYRKDSKAQGGWAIDAEAAEVVKLIFHKAAKGWTTRRISDFLNEQSIDIPSVYHEKKELYGNNRKVPDKECIWNIGQVRTILHRYEYTGAFVQNHREKILVGSGVTRAVPQSQRIIAENAHAAIVTKEEYKAAQAAIQFMRKPDFKLENKYALKGKIRCGICKLAMVRLETAYDAVYYCPHKKGAGNKAGCCGEKFPAYQIERTVLTLLRNRLKLINSLVPVIGQEKIRESEKSLQDHKRRNQEIAALKAKRIRQYEAYATGRISREAYLSEKTALTAKIEEIQKEIDCVLAPMEKAMALSNKISRINSDAEKIMVHDKLTKEMADTFIETVYVYDAKTVEVFFKFDSLLAEAEEKCVKKA